MAVVYQPFSYAFLQKQYWRCEIYKYFHLHPTAISRSLGDYNVFYLEHDKKLLTINLLMIYL